MSIMEPDMVAQAFNGGTQRQTDLEASLVYLLSSMMARVRDPASKTKTKMVASKI